MAGGPNRRTTLKAVSFFESITERRIREAREAGLFNDLNGAGQPIPDLDKERPPGWWAARWVKEERGKLSGNDLDDDERLRLSQLRRLRARPERSG